MNKHSSPTTPPLFFVEPLQSYHGTVHESIAYLVKIPAYIERPDNFSRGSEVIVLTKS